MLSAASRSSLIADVMIVNKHITETLRWCCLLLLPFVAMPIFYLIDVALLLAMQPTQGIDDAIISVFRVLIAIFPAAAIAPRWKTVTALLFAVGINGFYNLPKPISPHWTYWVQVISMLLASAIAVALVYRRYGLRDFDRGWPAALAMILSNRHIRSITMSIIIGVCITLLSMGVYREWGTDPYEQFSRGFPLRVTYGSKWSVGFNTNHLGFILDSLLYGSIFHIILLARQRKHRK